MPHLRSLVGAALVAFLCAIGVARAGTPSSYSAASQPLGGYVGGPGTPDYVLMDQGSGCPTTTPCATVQSPSLRFGQPIQANCASISAPFTLQLCFDTSVNPNILKRWTGSAWLPVISALSGATVPLTAPVAMEVDQGSGCATGNTPCADVQVPHPYLQVPVQANCSTLTLTFNYEPCLNTSFSPSLLETYSTGSSTWLPDINFWPAASSPLNGTETVRATQGSGCATGATPCKDVSVPVPLLTIPVQTTCTSLLSPYQYETCIDTSDSPPELKVYIGTVWSPVGAFDTTNDVWTPPIGQGVIATLAASGTTNLGSVPQSSITITGNGTINSFGSSATVGNLKILRFTGTPTLVESSALIIPTGGGQTVLSTTGNTNSTTTLSSLASTTGIAPGQLVIGSGIPSGTTVISVNAGGSSVVMSNAATSGLTGIAISFQTSYSNQIVSAGDTALALYAGGGNWIILVYQGVAGTGNFATGPSSTTAGDAVIWAGGGHPALLDAGAPPQLEVATNAALEALATTTVAEVQRCGFYEAGDSACVTFTASGVACTLNTGAGDGGTQVPSVNGTCWLGRPHDPKQWGATGSSDQTTCSITGGSKNMTLAAAEDFEVGQTLFCMGAGALFSGTAPSLSMAATNGSGTTEYYTIRPIDGSLGVGAAITPVSVSTGARLGDPIDLKAGATATFNGTATVSAISVNGCSASTLTGCGVVIGSYVVGTDVPAGYTVSAIGTNTNPAGVITLNSGTNVGTGSAGVKFFSPTGGVFNTATITGSSPRYAVYAGTTSTLSAMNCLSVTPYYLGRWHDYGDWNGCPAWVPSTAAGGPYGEIYSSAIVSGAGTTTPVMATTATTTVSGASYNIAAHDDSTPVLNAVSSGQSPLSWSCGNYNVWQVIPVSSPMLITGNSCATVWGWGNGGQFNFGAGSDSSSLREMGFDDVNKTDGFDMVANDASLLDWRDIFSTDPADFFEITRSHNDRLSNLYASGNLTGDYCAYLTGNALAAPSTFVNNPLIQNLICGDVQDGYGFLADGDVDSIDMYDSGFFPSASEMVFQNSVGGNTGPNLGKFDNVGINNAWGVPLKMSAEETLFHFNHLYVQCVVGNGNSGVYAGSSTDVSLGGSSTIFGCDQDGIEAHGNFYTDGSTHDYGNNQYQGASGSYAKIAVFSTSVSDNLDCATGDLAGGGGTQPNETYGIEIATGAGGTPPYNGAIAVTSNCAGIVEPVIDSTGVLGAVRVDGAIGNSPTSATPTSPGGSTGTLTTANMLGSFIGSVGVPVVYVSGNVSGTSVTLTTPTASALDTAFPAPGANGADNAIFRFKMVNLGGSTATLAGGTNVTVSGTASTAAGGAHTYTCQFNATATAIACSG